MTTKGKKLFFYYFHLPETLILSIIQPPDYYVNDQERLCLSALKNTLQIPLGSNKIHTYYDFVRLF